MSKGARSLSEISESKFYEFLKRYEFESGFEEKWNNKLLENKRDENIQCILENVCTQHDRNNNIHEFFEDEFGIFFEEQELKTSKNQINKDSSFFDF